jgi:hypothetical protein
VGLGLPLFILFKAVNLDCISLRFQKVIFFPFICMEKVFFCKEQMGPKSYAILWQTPRRGGGSEVSAAYVSLCDSLLGIQMQYSPPDPISIHPALPESRG